MPVLATVYLLAIAGVSVWAIADDLKSGESRLRAVADAIAIIALGYLFVGYFAREVAQPLGRAAAPIFLLGLLWTGIAAHREIMEEDPDPDLSPRANLVAEHLGIFMGVLVFAPLIAFAGATAFQLWRATT